MNRRVNQALTTFLCAGLFGIAVPAFGQEPNGSGKTGDPLYSSNRLPDGQRDAAASPETYNQVDPGTSGGGRGPRGSCVTCDDTENEENCGIPTDTANGGCNSSPPVFGSLRCGQAFCGTGTTNGMIRDTDWWMFEIQHTSVVTLTVTADFAVHIGFGDLSHDCPIATLLAGVFGDECAPTQITQTLNPGTYVAFVAPQFLPTVACGAQYTGTLQCDVSGACPCPGDFDGDRVVSLIDLALILSSFGQQPSNNCMDIDQDGLVGLEDLSTFLPTFGSACP